MMSGNRESDIVQVSKKDWQAVIDDLAEVGADSLLEGIADEVAHYNGCDSDELQTVHLTRREWWEMIGAIAVQHGLYFG